MMQKLYKAALKCYFFLLSITVAALFTYCYFDMELIIEIVFFRWNWNVKI